MTSIILKAKGEPKTFEDISQSINDAQKLYLAGNFQQAYDIIVDSITTFDMLVQVGFHGPNLNKKEYQAIYMLAGNICAELGKYDEALKNYIKHQFFQLQINHDFIGVESLKLYKFSGTKGYTLNNLRNNEVTLTDPRVLNDIVDTPVFSWLNSPIYGNTAHHKKHLKILKESFSFLRSTSFCMDTEDRKALSNTLMWAHYANSHKGICVEYELGPQDFASNQVSYASIYRILKISYSNPEDPKEILDFTDTDTRINIRKGIATKSKDWQYENEVRMVAYTPTEKSKYVQCHLDTPNPIKAIYFGVKCPTQRKNAVRQIFQDRPEVNFYQMKINYSNIHRLDFEPC